MIWVVPEKDIDTSEKMTPETLSVTTFRMMTLSVMAISITRAKMRHQAWWHSILIVVMLSVTNKPFSLSYAQRCYAECRDTLKNFTHMQIMDN